MEGTSTAKTKWRKYCSVMGCGESKSEMFQFPSNIALRLKWKTVCKVQRSVSDSMFVCVRHFCPSDLIICVDGKRRVKKDAVPSLYLPDGRVVKRSRRNCIVQGCKLGPREGVTIHHLPKCPTRRETWLAPLHLEADAITATTFICSRHFKDTDFTVSGKGRKILRQTAFPSLNLPTGKECCKKSESFSSFSSSHRWKVLCECLSNVVEGNQILEGSDETEVVEAGQILEGSDETEVFSDEECPHEREVLSDDEYVDIREAMPITDVISEVRASVSPNKNSEEMSDVNRILEHFGASVKEGVPSKFDVSRVFQQLAVSEKNYSDAQTQCEKKFTLLDLLQTDIQCKSFLGVTMKLLNGLSELCQEFKPVSHNSVMTMKERVAMVLCKLHLNLTLECLGVLFGVGRKVCSHNFSPTVHLLARVLHCAIYWPSKEDNLKNMPKCFQKFKDTRVVLDCTEIPVDSPKCLKCRICMYSHYKGRLTVKFMVGVAPSGLLTFRSKCYGGKASDQRIFAESDLIVKNMLEPFSDAVMVDKGFKIDSALLERNIKLHRPPFVYNKQQLSVGKANFNAAVAHARVHVERAIQRMKLFQILNGKLSWHVVPDINDIVTVVMALVNLSPPILASERYLTKSDCGH